MTFLRSLSITAGALFFLNAATLQADIVLFGVQQDGAIAGDLAYGTDPITESSSAYLNTSYGGELHNRWFQRGVDGSGNTLYEISWQFSDLKTIADRFQNAVEFGETVDWTVNSPLIATPQNYQGVWRFSSTADNLSSKFDGSSGLNFVTEFDGAISGTGVWGAGSGPIDGGNGDFDSTATNGWSWGFGNLNGSDSFLPDANSGTLMLDGVLQTELPDGFRNFMYFEQVSAVPEPSSIALVGVAVFIASRTRRRRPTL